jgi:pilus assembly protein CpaF
MNQALANRVRNRLITSNAVASHSHVLGALREEGVVLGEESVDELVLILEREFNGAGVLQPLLEERGVTDVLVNGPDSVWCDRGQGLVLTDIKFGSDQEVRRLAQRLASTAERRLDDASPMVDAQLRDGTRLHCVLPPISTDGTIVSLRIPSARSFTLESLVAAGSIDESVADLLVSIIRGRLAFLISGGTGTGKTTVLSALLAHVDPAHRIVVVEDSAELNPAHSHVVRMQSRLANIEGKGSIVPRDLVRTSLRMRPDRIVVGEVCGPEVVELLTALNTGHEGGCGTVHANSPQAVPARLAALGLTAGIEREALHALIGSGLDAVIHLARHGGRRYVDSIHVLDFSESGLVTTRPALTRSNGQWVRQSGWIELLSRCEQGSR